ncbi:AMP-binding protein [Natronorubrum sp. DTA28]|uniref:AMP-binding protein n=1 Tax=Natronorubrum sp. DTA28 TaxID=3447019 RepID=UPI003F8375A7
MSNITSQLQDTVMKNQSAVAISGSEQTTFSKLWSQTDAFAGGLQDRDIDAGDAVAIRLSNPRAFLVAFYGTLRNGCVPVTVPTEYGSPDITTVLRETEANAYVTDETPFLGILNRVGTVRVAITVDIDARMGIDLPSFLDNDGMNSAGSRTGIDVVRQSDDDRGLIAYVGYDGGEPLGVAYSHSALTAAADLGGSIVEEGANPRHLGLLPLSNPIELMYGANAAILEGGEYHPHTDQDPEAARSLLAADDADRAFCSPRQYETLRELEADVDDSVAVLETTGLSLTRPDEAVDDRTGTPVRYRGRPETGLTHAVELDEDDPDSLGEPLPGIETRTLEDGTDGELSVSGPTTMDGYVARPALTDETIASVDGTRWIRTGSFDGDETGVSRAGDQTESNYDRSRT